MARVARIKEHSKQMHYLGSQKMRTIQTVKETTNKAREVGAEGEAEGAEDGEESLKEIGFK